MNLLFVGDIFARPGRQLLQRALPRLVERREIDFVIANVENVAAGAGLTAEIGESILRSGVDVMTSGNHIWSKKEVLGYIQLEPRLLRPANHPAGAPGRGSYVGRTRDGESVGVLNVIGRVFMLPLDDPFRVAREEIAHLQEQARIIVVDIHAEASSEKIAMGWHLDGMASAVLGTHTHVQTADERILPNGTAYITDVGMTGAHDGVIGLDREAILNRFLTGLPARAEPATGDVRLNAVIVSVDPRTGRAQNIERLSCASEELELVDHHPLTEAR